ncbi:MAG: hypothetical protein JWP45_2910 [Mucilaginibacter sp.]|nr:hypothetical protein [Mucilaginibacter sp.]
MDIKDYLELFFAIGGSVFGAVEYFKRQRLENVFKTITQAYPGDVAKIEQSCTWAWNNVKNAHEALVKLADSEEKRSAMKSINLATGDTKASQIGCSLLFNQLLSFQQAQFKTRIIKHQDKDTLPMCISEARNNH